MGAEYERKYAAGKDIQAAILQEYPGPWQQISMETTYYDTPTGGLSARRYMLRTRLENGVRLCTLKTPGADNLRGEWEVPCEDILQGVEELCKLSVPQDFSSLCREGLAAICGARFTRRALLLTLPDCTAELALDQGILFSGDKTAPLSELELELKSGSIQVLDRFAGELVAGFGLTPEEKSKFARALALYREV